MRGGGARPRRDEGEEDWGARATRALASLTLACPEDVARAHAPEALRHALTASVVAHFGRAIARANGLPTEGLAHGWAPPLTKDERTRESATRLLDDALDPFPASTTADDLGAAYEAILSDRRRGGCHYTSPPLAERIAAIALLPLLEGEEPGPSRIVDPAMGSGACLLAAFRLLTRRAGPSGASRSSRRALASTLFGADVDPLATAVARLSLWIELGDPEVPPTFADEQLVTADALGTEWPPADQPPFDAVVGNPPWVSYVGRAAQPLEPARRAHFASSFAAFAGYRNLQGLFLERAASILRPGGRLALLVPSSMSEQLGYAPTRRALDRVAQVDASLCDVGEHAFPGVFQPCMIVAGTRRDEPRAAPSATAWPVERADLDDAGRALLARLAALPPLPADLFGERGVQTSGGDAADLAESPDDRHTLALRGGADVVAFGRGPARAFADPARIAGRFRDADWSAVALLIRQTAAFPIAAIGDGAAFRNSLLAGFEGHGYSRWLLVAWLNASPIRWHHQMRFRDARQGMPQVKVGHLRTIPAPRAGPTRDRLEALGEQLGTRNRGIDRAEQASLDELAGAVLGLDAAESEIIALWRDRAAPSRLPRRATPAKPQP